MSVISSSDGPVAVTGASGYIGSWIVRDLVDQGYQVRACVRDANSCHGGPRRNRAITMPTTQQRMPDPVTCRLTRLSPAYFESFYTVRAGPIIP